MPKLWQGRFEKETDQTVNDFNASIPFDARFYDQDIRGSMAHAAMLEKQGILTTQEFDEITTGLQEIRTGIATGEIFLDTRYEDIHTAVEVLLTQKTAAGKKLHTARSRNDQVALDMRLYVKETIPEIKNKLLDLVRTITDKAQAHTHTVMPGYTHLQRAQPITFAHAMMAYGQMFARDVRRLENTMELMDESPLGACALAGTTHPIDRFQTAETLGFARPMANSLDAVSDRDYLLELLSDLSILMMHLSRMSEEIIAWCSWEFKFIELDDAYSTGSSIMPQKKNPDICELVRGKTGRVYGHLMALLTTMKGLPLAYNKDMQEDKQGVFDAIDTVLDCLEVMPPMLETMTVLEDNMKKAGEKGFINATDCADYLAAKGMPFRDAYKLTGQLVTRCLHEGKALQDLDLQELQQESRLFDEDFYEAVSLEACVTRRNVFGGPAPQRVQEQINAMKEFVHEHEKDIH